MITLTFISDTHNKHKELTKDLIGGDILIHTGDLTSMGYEHEIREFAKWFNSLHHYQYKIFIAGNHDWGFQNNSEKVNEILSFYDKITYLQDASIVIDDLSVKPFKIYGSPWQPEFYNWAFNLPRDGWELEQKWNDIPNDTDILLTHGPAFGYVDKVKGSTFNLGCELLTKRISAINPKIHVCGHIHTGYGYTTNQHTHFINASVLNERYLYSNYPLHVKWDNETNEISFK